MQPTDASLVVMLDGSKQFIIPRFQRPYTWKTGVKSSAVKRFWDDILDSDYSNSRHFTGSIVFTNTSLGTMMLPCYYIIDGQQRLITTSLMLCAFNKILQNDSRFIGVTTYIQSLLNNKFESAYGSKLKIVPSEEDYEIYECIINDKKIIEKYKDHNMVKAFNFFLKEINKIYSDGEEGKDSVEKLYNSILEKIHVCAITIDDGEDPASIFESLNGKGETLDRIDLIRNYVLMNLPSQPGNTDYQKMFYDSYWKDFQKSFEKSSEAETFLRAYLMVNGGRVSNSTLYETVKEKINSLVSEAKIDGVVNPEKLYELVSSFMKDVDEFIGYYHTIIGKKSFESVRFTKIVDRSLEDLKHIGASTFRPYLMKAFHAFNSDSITEEELVWIIRTINSYFMRRSMYTGLINNKVDGLFIQLCEKPISFESLYDKLSSQQESKTFWPDDTQLQDDIFRSRPVYSESGNDTLKWILHRLDEKENGKPLYFTDDDSIEHVFPRTPEGSKWEGCVDYDFLYTHRDYLGNLTISDHNSNHARLPYNEKRQQYIQKENHPLTRKLANEFETWDKASVEKHASNLAKSIFTTWPKDKNELMQIPKW